MNLKILNINFQSRDEFLNEIKGSLFENKKMNSMEEGILFDSIDTFKRVMGRNKLQILMAISQLKPESVYQLEKLLVRKYPHVLKDCRQLESLGFIRLVQSDKVKRQLCPVLVFDYDIIKVNSDLMEIFPISKNSNQILLKANAG